MCKYNYASYVKINPPQGRPRCPGWHDECRAMYGINDRYPRRFRCLRFCLTFLMRLNYYYTAGRHQNGQTPPARSEDQRTETGWYAQSPCGNRDRSPLPAKSLLRFPRSSAGPLRDAAAPSCRGNIDPRSSGGFWRLASHVLSGPGVFRAVRPGGLGARSAGPEGWAQADWRSSGLCGQSARVRSEDHYGLVRQSHTRTFCNLRPHKHCKLRTLTALNNTLLHDEGHLVT